MRKMAILGATGSIGTQALTIVRRYPDEYTVSVLTAHSSADALFALAREFRPVAAALVVEPESIPDDMRGIEWFFGVDASERALRAARPDDVLAAAVGIAGLPQVMAALEVCERVLLANKEALVTGGELVMRRAAELQKTVLPVDSEHSAIFQCLQGRGDNIPERLILTASGGPFRTWNKQKTDAASVEEALGHPTWKMGAKVTIDSATMMNKGLEVIEAHHLFSMPAHKIDVTVHPESIVHSMVEYSDGAVLAQMSLPDMRTAIGYAMGYPARVPFGAEQLNLARLGMLTFEAPDCERFPCLSLAYDALKAGGVMPIALNGANEVAVSAFLDRRITFGGIPELVHETLMRVEQKSIKTIEDVYEADRRARNCAGDLLKVKG